ncbi:hypothetical protein F5Y00DRAFT_271299 [Daldinia vernicosa]|uniref:uncharacterized protein n=1 Tax=Daldinia vernicosa TaxID=114800 RepID=UPI002008B180|nr:uncharacterized protein F5Y00DRAFT_271299 [Daldinia vernicosa]KAI0847185.1 hypothetical protein F5Y00DRAFT_271299 [Daldinia vernicosa]
MPSTIKNLLPPPVDSLSLEQISRPACPQSDFQNDILVVLRVDVTEIHEKLPIHFETVLRCVPDYVIYSDAEETIGDHHIYDFLGQANETLRNAISEFELYNQLHISMREEQECQKRRLGSTPQPPNKRLQQWKLLPIADRALKYRPQARWFVFLEADTYMVWPNVLEYLAKFNAEQPYYLGGGMNISDVLFPPKGLGFALSNPAIKKVAEYWKEYQNEWRQSSNERWVGDITLEHALGGIEKDLIRTFPYLQVNGLTTLDWAVLGSEKRFQCPAPLIFHHMTEEEFTTMWKFEQERLHRNWGKGFLTFRDIFKRLIYHQIKTKRARWDNMSVGIEYSDKTLGRLSNREKDRLSPAEQEAPLSFEKCRAACESKPTCIQFSYTQGSCLTSGELRLGHTVDSKCANSSRVPENCVEQRPIQDNEDIYSKDKIPIQSGWIMKRVSSYYQNLDWSCDNRRKPLYHTKIEADI